MDDNLGLTHWSIRNQINIVVCFKPFSLSELISRQLIEIGLQSITNFAETDSLPLVDISVVERYLVKVLAGARSNTTADTFDKFRHDSYFNGKALN